MHDDLVEDHDGGLAHDLALLARRRDVLRWMGGAALLPIGACADASPGPTYPDGASSGAACVRIPEETAGPFPGDGTNGPNILAASGVIRRDLRPSLGPARGIAEGVPLTVTLDLVGAGACRALAGFAVYLWHCDRAGNYSMYSPAVAGETYLRGVQIADAAGSLAFTTIFPGCYVGRWPHLHFEVYAPPSSPAAARMRVATSQIALAEEACHAVFATHGYEASVSNLARLRLDRDEIFHDGMRHQLASIHGDVVSGLGARLVVAV